MKTLETIKTVANTAMTTASIPAVLGASVAVPLFWFAGGTIGILALVGAAGIIFAWKEYKERKGDEIKVREGAEKLSGTLGPASNTQVQRAVDTVLARS